MSATIPEVTTPGDLGDQLAGFLRSMRRENVSNNTIQTYGTAVRLFAEWQMAQGLTTDTEAITAEHIEAWELGLLDRQKAATVHNRHRGLQRFLSWYVEKRERDMTDDERRRDTWHSPMAHMKPPKLPAYAPRVLTIDELKAIIGVCKGPAFDERRDEAIIRVLFNTGLRRAEVTNLRYSPTDPDDRDIDLRRNRIKINSTSAKGRKERTVAIDETTVEAIERYLEKRKKHDDTGLPWLWLGARGKLTDSGLAQAVRKRGQLAGIAGLHPHELRHAWMHHMDRAGASRETLMALGGWSSDAMLRRYASSTGNERAIEHAAKIGLGDKL